REANTNLNEALKSHLIPSGNASPIWDKGAPAFEQFLKARAELLYEELKALLVEDAISNIEPIQIEIGSSSVAAAEIQLRDLIDGVLEATSGKAYWGRYMPYDVVELVKSRINDQRARHPGDSGAE